jgi:hypothetical protein
MLGVPVMVALVHGVAGSAPCPLIAAGFLRAGGRVRRGAQGYLLNVRLYGLTHPFYDGSWIPGDVIRSPDRRPAWSDSGAGHVGAITTQVISPADRLLLEEPPE